PIFFSRSSTSFSPKLKEQARMLLCLNPQTPGWGSDHRISWASPLGVVMGLSNLRMSSNECSRGESPDCIHRILPETTAAKGRKEKTSLNFLYTSFALA
ncbi:hypothetical protein PMAYCL1PPCAC_12741, partial [Pristionchus mayeri]